MTRRWTLALALVAASGCPYGREPYSSVTRLRHAPCPAGDGAAELHFENDEPAQKYSTIGLIEVVGGTASTDEELLDEMRRQALRLGANAVVAVRKQFKTREEGTTDPLSRHEHHAYGATVFTGIAVCLGPREQPPAPCAAEEAWVRADPFDTAGHDRLARCEWKAGRYLEMANHARTAIRDNPGYVRGYLNLSQAERALGNVPAAEAAARKARAAARHGQVGERE